MIDSTPELDAEWGPVLRAWPELGEVAAVINTHLHFDHCGGNRRFAGTPTYVQRAELEAAVETGLPRRLGAFHGESYVELDGDADLFDGVSVLFTPGHSPGHQSVVVETGDGLVVLGGDVTYSMRELIDGATPSILPHPRAAARARVPRAPRAALGAGVQLRLMDAFIVDAVRSPIGRKNGTLSALRGDDLAAQVLNGLIARHDLDPAEIEDVQMGCVTQIGEQGWNVGRMAVLAAGWPVEVSATTVDRQCGSSMQTNFNARRGGDGRAARPRRLGRRRDDVARPDGLERRLDLRAGDRPLRDRHAGHLGRAARARSGT